MPPFSFGADSSNKVGKIIVSVDPLLPNGGFSAIKKIDNLREVYKMPGKVATRRTRIDPEIMENAMFGLFERHIQATGS
ncbi:hypothetical protein Pfo_015651 [Paulownia fortunei]|nr:hypothetical protein Pfo_015651 [Paulownia fortunei]